MKLVEIGNTKEINRGDIVRTFRDEMVEVVSFQPPAHYSRSGKVTVKHESGMIRAYYPAVIHAEYIGDLPPDVRSENMEESPPGMIKATSNLPSDKE